MKYFFDTEFIEYPCKIDLISIGIVAEDGRELYCINWDCDFSKADEWVRKNVICKLPFKPLEYPNEARKDWVRKSSLSKIIKEFIGDDKPEFWAYYADYDWVVFCWLFGKMIDLPEGWPMYCRDIKQWCDQLGNPELPKQGKGEHDALDDAKWNMKAWNFLNEIAV